VDGPAFALSGQLGNNDVVKSTGPLTGAAARVAQALLEGGPQTAAALAERLDLSTTAVRRHLDALVESGHVESGDRAPYGPQAVNGARGPGRPARVYSVTDSGRESFESAYDDLAVGALRFLSETGGPGAVQAFAAQRVRELERRYADAVASACPDDRPAALAAALSADGFAASVTEGATSTTVQICQHHCPVGHVAAEFPELCDAETEAFGRLLGTHVTRLATLAHGDGVCTTLVSRPAADAMSTTGAPSRTTRSASEVLS
jgi:predicted ArsR family transcriptional regulator